jgi:hypothetical protein
LFFPAYVRMHPVLLSHDPASRVVRKQKFKQPQTQPQRHHPTHTPTHNTSRLQPSSLQVNVRMHPVLLSHDPASRVVRKQKFKQPPTQPQRHHPAHTPTHDTSRLQPSSLPAYVRMHPVLLSHDPASRVVRKQKFKQRPTQPQRHHPTHTPTHDTSRLQPSSLPAYVRMHPVLFSYDPASRVVRK